MTFTDDDVKRLKIPIADPNYRRISHDETMALLARLEAAEVALQFMFISEYPIDESSSEAYEVWRKIAGKL